MVVSAVFKDRDAVSYQESRNDRICQLPTQRLGLVESVEICHSLSERLTAGLRRESCVELREHEMNDFIDRVLQRLTALIHEDRYEEQETETVEIKPVPSEGGGWRELHKSANAFLNTRGGIIILGIKEDGQGNTRRYIFSGYREEAEAKLKDLPALFTDRSGAKLDLRDYFPLMQIREFMDGRVALLFVEELPADRKYVFYRNEAYQRILTGDHKITEVEIDRQEEYRKEVMDARELQPWPGADLDDLDLDALNDYIQHLNRPRKIETMKADMETARPFLERKKFIKDNRVTLLGMLVCGKYPADHLGFRCHVHGYVDVPDKIAQDKQDLIDNILPLMESSLSYILRNIQVGISAERGGMSTPQYPEEILRETVNNALAHRDYSLNKQATISIKPGRHIAIKNPGTFRNYLLIEQPDHEIPLRRIIPEAKARNPKLADVLRVYSKWEGKGIGMATLVNLCLENRIDLPVYRLFSEEVCLFLRAGKLLDERMESHFKSFDAYIERKTNGLALNDEEKRVLAYLIKSEWENEHLYYTVLLTPGNNHFEALLALERNGLIWKHPLSTAIYPVYVVDRALIKRDYFAELMSIFGESFPRLNEMPRGILNIIYRHGRFSKTPTVTAKTAAIALWHEKNPGIQDIHGFDTFYRRVRYFFNTLERSGFIMKIGTRVGYVISENYRNKNLF
jgi:ATP-dependent DNA helicase RecG